MEQLPVVVTGLGVFTSNGKNIPEFFEHCMKGQMGIQDSSCPIFDTENLRTNHWAYVSSIEEDQISPQNHVYRNRILAEHAIDEALADARLCPTQLAALKTRAAITLGSLSYDDYHILETANSLLSGEPEKNLKYLPRLSDFATHIKNYCGITGACYNFSSACASGTAAIGVALNLIASQQCDIVVVCGVDPLSQLVGYGFHSLKALSQGICHPLDQNRDGINIGEGCGVIVLENELHAKRRNASIYAKCLACSLGNEAFHITSPDTSGEGFYQSMHTALERANLSPAQIDYVNLHGTGTRINDEIELLALDKLYSSSHKKPFVSSLKTLLGHCMGASGTLEAIITILCLKNQHILPIFRVQDSMPEILPYTTHPDTLFYALSNSFAFAGNTASVVLAAPDVCPKTSLSSCDIPVYLNGIGLILPTISGTEELKLRLGFIKEKSDTETSGTSTAISPHTLPAPTNGIPAKKLRGVNHLSRLVLSTALQISDNCGSWESQRTGSTFSSSYGSVTDRIEFAKHVTLKEAELCNPTIFANISPNAPLGHLCIALKIKGDSVSMHGGCPIPVSLGFIKNACCDQVFSCVAEEYNKQLADAFADRNSFYHLPYQESCIHLLLQNKRTTATYAKLDFTIACSIGGDPLVDPVAHSEEEAEQLTISLTEIHKKLPYRPDAIFVMGFDTAFDHLEYTALAANFPDSPIGSGTHLFGGLQHNTLYANVAIAGLCLQEGMLSKSLFPLDVTFENKHPVTSILVTGYDSCGNYHCLLLTNTVDSSAK